MQIIATKAVVKLREHVTISDDLASAVLREVLKALSP